MTAGAECSEYTNTNVHLVYEPFGNVDINCDHLPSLQCHVVLPFTWYDLQYFEVNVFSPGNSMLTKFGNFIDADEDWQDVSERLEHKRGVVLRMFKTLHVFLVIEPSQ